MHRDLGIVAEQPAESDGILRMRLAACQPVLLPQQRADQLRRAGIQAEGAHQSDVVLQRGRYVVQQSGNAGRRLIGAPRRIPREIVMTGAGVGIQHEQRPRLALQGAQQRDQQRVLHAIAEIAGVKCVPVIHRANASSGQRGRGAKSIPSTRPRRSRSSPVQATMTALSVQRRMGGATNWNPCVMATRSNAPRTA